MVEEADRDDRRLSLCRVDFIGSADLVLPEGAQWDASGKDLKKCDLAKSVFFFFFIIFVFFLGTMRDLNMFFFIMQTEGWLSSRECHHLDDVVVPR
jgi:hypothetical protein